MKKQAAFFISVIFILCSCIDKPQVQTKLIDDFPEPTKLKGEEVFEKHFRKATVQHFDSLIILTADMDNLFHVFNKEDKLIASFGREGRGPSEFIRTPFISDIYRQDSASYGFVYDEIMGKLVNINYTASISEDEVVVHNRPELPSKLHKSTLTEVFYIGENEYTGMIEDRFFNQIDQQRSRFYYNTVNEKFILRPLLNLEMQPYERMAEINLNKRWARISPDRSKLAFGMLYYPVVEITEVGSDNIDRFLMEPNPPEGPFEPADYEEDKLTQYILRLDVTNDNIFILKSTKNEDNNSDKGQEICVIDWEGNPQNKFILSNEYQLDYITVDEKNKHIYGISYRNDKSYKFDFSHVN